ncbi:hypothetical protein BGZ83_009745 [Gryganskiella cystojenkinii]|nr:hypothetical protein BGZ83_009745 [Gryganskiella cystojenkinii]
MSESSPTTITQYPRRPAYGKKGAAIQVRSNYFEITKLPSIRIHHYDVTVTPDVPPPVNRKICDQFITSHRALDLNNTSPVYDGRKNLFSAKEFPFDSRTFDIILAGDVRPNSNRPPPTFKLKVKKAATINLEELHQFLQGKASLSNSCLTAIMALDILIRHKPAMLYATVGRSFYTPQGKQPLTGPLDVWRGFYQSARPAVGKMMVNIDVSATAFYQSGPLLEMVTKILGLRSPDDLRRSVTPVNWKKVERYIKGLRVTAIHRTRSTKTFKIFNLTEKSAKDTCFSQRVNKDDPNSKEFETDVASYFMKAYNMTLTYPTLPCVAIGKFAMLPIEVCSVVEGQRYPKKLDERQTADMIKFTCQPPSARANSIKDGLRILNYEGNEFLKDFGMKVANEMVTIQARVLNPPTVSYHSSSRDASFVPRDGAWNLKDKKVVVGSTLGSWGVVIFGTERDVPAGQISGFIRELVGTCIATGLNIVNKNPPIAYNNPQGNIEASLKQAWVQAGNAVKSQPQLLVCILPNTGVPLYAEIKRVTDTVLGVSSQCLQVKHTRDPKKQYCANVCLKMNAKLGGSNQHLAANQIPFVSTRPTIIFGGDVTHPQPGDTTRPSIACVVGSMDRNAARYSATIRVQAARTETITDLGDMTIELLKSFFQSSGQKPERIVFYRDGVSESQFAEVLQMEVAALKAACHRLDPNYNPSVTFVVVQKRHHTRFFPMKREEGDRLGNCKPGTVIDQTIVHPFEYDFYLQSHGGLLGTSRPAHYYVLHDDNKFGPDDLQEMTYKLCHLFARCTRTVSVVPPAYYAHMVAARARFHSKGEHWSDTVSSGSGLGEASSYQSVRAGLSKVMWFM